MYAAILDARMAGPRSDRRGRADRRARATTARVFTELALRAARRASRRTRRSCGSCSTPRSKATSWRARSTRRACARCASSSRATSRGACARARSAASTGARRARLHRHGRRPPDRAARVRPERPGRADSRGASRRRSRPIFLDGMRRASRAARRPAEAQAWLKRVIAERARLRIGVRPIADRRRGRSRAVGVTAYWFVELRGRESTDDAFVEGHLVFLSPRVAGQVVEVLVEENQHVQRGPGAGAPRPRRLRGARRARARRRRRRAEPHGAVARRGRGRRRAEPRRRGARCSTPSRSSRAPASLVRAQRRGRTQLDAANAERDAAAAELRAARAARAGRARGARQRGARAAGRGGAARGRARARARRRSRRPSTAIIGKKPSRSARTCRPASRCSRSPRDSRQLDRRELQGDPDRAHARGRAASRSTSTRSPASVARPRRVDLARDRRQVRAAAARQRDRQLHEGRAAHAGADRARRASRPDGAPDVADRRGRRAVRSASR